MTRCVNRSLPASASVLFGVALVVCLNTAAQDTAVVARAAEVSGQVLITSGSLGLTNPLGRGAALNPGDRIDTRGGGRLTIELNDGSMVLVQPGTLLVLKDFKAASSLRELFEIALGRVRVKINHFVGRPNPYRMNSPTASIAVRGTEFSVEVGLGGETQVMVYDGAVEVTYLNDPNHSILLQAGRGVLVVPGQDFRLLNVAGNRGRDDNARRDDNHEPPPPPPQQVARNDNRPPPAPPGPGPRNGVGTGGAQQPQFQPRRSDPAPTQTDSSAAYVASLAQIAETPFTYRYNAFPELHLDSLENPAYSASFRQTEVRLFAMPSLGGPRGFETNGTPQLSMFTPLLSGRVVVGGAASRSTIGAINNATGNFFSGSASAALNLDARGRSALGFEIERWAGNIALNSDSAAVSQTRLTFGFSQELGRGHKFGVLYRTGLIDSHGRSSEIAVRLRGSLTRRLFYGATASWMNLSLSDAALHLNAHNDLDHGTAARRSSAAIGIGYLLNSRTILSADLAGGNASVGSRHSLSDGHFISLQGAVQRDITHRLFVTGSILGIRQRYPTNVFANPYVMSSAAFSDYGIGWRFSRDFFVQYLVSTNYTARQPSHLLMLRYTFHSERE